MTAVLVYRVRGLSGLVWRPFPSSHLSPTSLTLDHSPTTFPVKCIFTNLDPRRTTPEPISRSGNPLLPVSYQEMEDSVTGRIERRKVAKPEGV